MGVRDEVGAREGQQEDSDTTNEEAVRRAVRMRGLPQTWRNAHCWTRPGSQKTATKQRESTQSRAVTPKDASREGEHRTASRTPAARRCRGGGQAEVLTHRSGEQPQAPGSAELGALCYGGLGNCSFSGV